MVYPVKVSCPIRINKEGDIQCLHDRWLASKLFTLEIKSQVRQILHRSVGIKTHQTLT